jgi:two-component system cell cycle sensor histidine kinase/response regulator CckA
VTAATSIFETRSRETDGLFHSAAPHRFALPRESAGAPAVARDMVCTHDLSGRFLSVNQALCEALGLSEDAILGMTVRDLLASGGTSGFAAYIQTVTRHSFAAGRMKVLTQDHGQRIWEYCATMTTNREAPTVRTVARDVTELAEALKAVRNSEEQFRSIIENASDVILIVELDGCIRYQSPSIERVLGYPADVLVGTPIVDIIHPDDTEKALALLAEQLKEPGATLRTELRARHYRGSWRSFEIVANILARNGRPSAIVVNARDITERKLLEAQLLQANRLSGLGRLAATVAHEFNNVLMGMQPFAELMQRPDATPQMISKGAGHIANSIQRGKRIVLDILRFTQPYVPITAAVDVRDWWNAFVPEAEAVLGNAIQVVSIVPSGLCVIADRTQLSQVLANLVANARDAMGSGGRLIVEATALAENATFPFGVVPHPERFVHIAITDNGHGMPAEVMENIFEPLYTTRESGGTGLGLAVAHQVMMQHDGSIFVESEPGRGTTFHLFLPKAAAPACVAAHESAQHPAPAAKRLLIIEDEESIVEGIKALLECSGIAVEGIGSGFEAAEAIGRFDPDVVLLDYGLPGMDGGEVYTLIRKLDESIPIIFATGHGDRRVLHDSLNDTRTRFLQKPFEVTDLLAMMSELEAGETP